MRELRAVARAAAALRSHIPKINLLPNNFPREQVEGFCDALVRLPEGSAEGSIAPLRAADSELNRIRQRFIPAYDEEDGGPEPLVARDSDLDLRLVSLTAAVRSAIERYKAESGDSLDTDVAPDRPPDESARDAIDKTIVAAEGAAQNALAIGAAIDDIEDKSVRAELATERMLANDAGIHGETAAAALKTEAPRPNVLDWLADGVDKTAEVMEQHLTLHREKLQRIGKECGDSALELVEIWIPKIPKSLKVLKKLLGNVSTILRGDSVEQLDADLGPLDYIEVYNRLLSGRLVPEAWIPYVAELDFNFDQPHHMDETDIGQIRGDPENFTETRLLENLTSLRSLKLWRTKVADTTPLANLTALQLLSITGSQVVDITPLANLKDIRELNLWFVSATDFTPLATLTTLQSLDLSGSKIADLKFLVGLTDLQSLELVDTEIKDITPLAKLTDLQMLDLSSTQVNDVLPLANLIDLRSLYLASTKVTDITPLSSLFLLKVLDLEGVPVTDFTPLTGLTGLQSLDLANTQITDVAPIESLTNLTSLYLAGTQVTDVRPLANLTSLQVLDLTGTPVKDITPLSAIKDLAIIGFDDEQQTSPG